MLNFTEEREELFFDTNDSLRSSVDSASSEELVGQNRELGLRSFDYEFWMSELMSIRERRNRFLLSTGFDKSVLSQLSCQQEIKELTCERSYESSDLERINERTNAVLDPLSSLDSDQHQDSFSCIRDLDSGKKFVVHDLGQDAASSLLKEVGTDRIMTLQEFETVIGLSHSVLQFMRRERASSREKRDGGLLTRKKKHRSWWRNLVIRKHVSGMCKDDVNVKSSKLLRPMRTKVQQHGKKCLEFSALYMDQEIQAHRGLIMTMKFNSSGRYLASGGEDCIVRIWEVRQVEASCKCFTANGSKCGDELRDGKLMPRRKGYHSPPIVLPKNVFKIKEAPLHEYHGHTSDVLDLSWSETDVLLSSSKDHTVRLWKVGCNRCLKVFQHNDFVTCTQFNPVDESYFISGSIDGKVRIWGISENRVVDWMDVGDIVTTVCYRPDGKGFVVGSITGNCRFYDYSGNNMQLESKFCIQGKKKSAGKPITGLQFSPEEPEKLVITSLDSQVRVYNGINFIHKFRGRRKSKSQLSASFTSDGRYIISVGEDSHVYIWNYCEGGIPSTKGAKSTRSCEHFFSEGVSVAVPWPGLEHGDPSLNNDSIHSSSMRRKILEPPTWLRDPDWFSVGVWFFADGSRVSATWPEEKLPALPEPVPEVDNMSYHHHHQQHLHHHYQCLTSLSATWNLVIVTASADGFIRSFHNYGLPLRL